MDIAMTLIRVVASIVTLIYAFRLVYKARQSNFRPYWPVRRKIGVVGFLGGYSLMWALLGDGLLENAWMKLLFGTISAGQIAFRFAGTIETTMKKPESA